MNLIGGKDSGLQVVAFCIKYYLAGSNCLDDPLGLLSVHQIDPDFFPEFEIAAHPELLTAFGLHLG